MTIFGMTDLHGSLRHLSALRNEVAAANLVVVGGDITNFGGREEARRVIEELLAVNKNLLAVTGNCDRRSVEDYLRDLDVDLHASTRTRGGVVLAGLSGSLPGPGPTPNTYSEEELRSSLDSIKVDTNLPLILVSHQPPFDTPADVVAAGRHVGSRAVREFVEKARPMLCLTGHIHESIGQGDLAGCRVVNPGPFGQGRYALIEVGVGGHVHVELRIAS